MANNVGPPTGFLVGFMVGVLADDPASIVSDSLVFCIFRYMDSKAGASSVGLQNSRKITYINEQLTSNDNTE